MISPGGISGTLSGVASNSNWVVFSGALSPDSRTPQNMDGTHCKYFGGTHYCGCLCYVSSSSLRVLRAANDSALPMAVPNPKYSHKK